MFYLKKAREKYDAFIQIIRKKRKPLLVIFSLMLLSLIFFRPLIAIFFFIVAAVVSRLYEWFFKGLGAGIELMTFGTVLCSIAYGPWAGFFVGATGITLSVFLNQEQPKFLPISWIGLFAVSRAVQWLYGMEFPILYVGLTASVLYNIIVDPAFVYFLKSRISKVLFFASTNIVFNYFLFSKFGADLLAILI